MLGPQLQLFFKIDPKWNSFFLIYPTRSLLLSFPACVEHFEFSTHTYTHVDIHTRRHTHIHKRHSIYCRSLVVSEIALRTKLAITFFISIYPLF